MNIIEGIQKQQQRCRELIGNYEEIGPSGSFGKMMIQQDIDYADRAIAEGDTIEMIAAYQRLEACK